MTRIGVIGSAIVGQTLAGGLKKHGYDVRIASRTPDKLADFSSKSGIPTAGPSDVAGWAEALVLAVKGTAAESALREAGESNINGKVVLDATNPIANEPPDDGVLRFFTSPNESLMERLQLAFPSVKFVKAFNSVSNQLMIDPQFPGGRPTMFYCGNDPGAKALVARIIDSLGWEGADMGRAAAARAIEPLCQLYCIRGLTKNEWNKYAFRWMQR
jgi:8-hydroxy-5-deazaflavin:NADPH oxidoreductase